MECKGGYGNGEERVEKKRRKQKGRIGLTV